MPICSRSFFASDQGRSGNVFRGPNAYETALSILRDFRGLRGLDRARIHDLLKVPGLGPAKVAQIKAAFELGKRACAGKLIAPAFESSLAVANHFRPRFTGKREEIVIAVFLNGQNQHLVETCKIDSLILAGAY